MLIIASGYKTVCIDVLKFKDIEDFISKSAKILLSFDSKTKTFPFNLLKSKTNSLLREYLENDYYDYVVTMCDSTIQDLYKLKIRVIDKKVIIDKKKEEYLTRTKEKILLNADYIDDFSDYKLYLEEVGISFFSLKIG
jgi:hypothetical protein